MGAKKEQNWETILGRPPTARVALTFQNAVKKIITICHKRLPDIRRPDLPIDESLRYQQSLLALFRPFRSASDFEPEGICFDDFFQMWFDAEAPSSAHRFVKHNTDYYASQERLKTQPASEVDCYVRYDAGEDEDELDDNCTHDMADSDTDNQDDGSANDDYDLPTKSIDMLERSNLCSSLAASSTLNSTVPTGSFTMSISDVEQCMRSEINAENLSNCRTSVSALLDNFPELPTRVQLLQRAIQTSNSQTQSNQSEATSQQSNTEFLQDFPSLQQVSSAFRLNRKQNKMFFQIGTDLLTSCLVGHHPEKQRSAFLGGLPGVGKSRVIGALQGLSKAWKSSEAVTTAAYQGVAAQAANG
ncbi:hypothetical protein JG688_00001475 [Phytophthora aleatoria]|uniref:Uncharacterized protein n=1 Tax=Phytophthora aleatoria TaxID=2496075 RepID=A0A8J5M9H2_9STRA|nr:hypothetical protein JG688_00001475 [Phytophthora aleatoria]